MHGVLAGLGLIPAIGIVPDFIDLVLYGLEGDLGGFAGAGLAMIPILGQGSRLAQYGGKLLKPFKGIFQKAIFKLPSITTADGFLLKGFQIKAPFNIPVQRFGLIHIDRADFWGAKIGANKLLNRVFAAIKKEWNPLTQYTKGVISKGSSIKIGIIGPQGLKNPGGSIQIIIDSKDVISQQSRLINR